MFDASYPLIKRGVCLRHHRNICNALAPPDRHTDKTPALWATLGPLRDYLVPHGPAWVQQHANYATYLHHYLTYQLQMGISGVIYYGNAWSLGMLQQQPILHTYLRDGTLRWVAGHAWWWCGRLGCAGVAPLEPVGACGCMQLPALGAP